MKTLLPLLFIVFTLAGCAPHAAPPARPSASGETGENGALYRIRIRRGSETRFSGLIGLQPVSKGMETVLLDATGVPLVKGLVLPNGNMDIDYAPKVLQEKRLPELIGKLVKYIYFTSGTMDCSWYIPYQVCQDSCEPGSRIKQAKFGPLRLWQVQTVHRGAVGETIEVETLLPPLVITMDRVSQR